MSLGVARVAALSSALAVLSAACSHPATPEECEKILEKTAELKLRERFSDPVQIEEQIAAYKRSQGEKVIDKCVGKKINEGTIGCIEKAESQDQIDTCLLR
jgi:predicted transcriptional regulator